MPSDDEVGGENVERDDMEDDAVDDADVEDVEDEDDEDEDEDEPAVLSDLLAQLEAASEQLAEDAVDVADVIVEGSSAGPGPMWWAGSSSAGTNPIRPPSSDGARPRNCTSCR